MSRAPRCLAGAALLGSALVATACPWPAVRTCGPDEEPCPTGSFCDPAEGYCVALPEGGSTPSADASSDGGAIDRDGGSRDQIGRDQRAADTRPGDTAPIDQAEHDGALPDTGPPDGVPADTPVPDAGPPDRAIPDLLLVDQARPDLLLADQAALDTSAPDTIGPDTFVPDTFVPDTSAPDTSAPDTSAPDTFVPDACQPPAGPSWWDPSYTFRYPLSVEAAPAAYTVELSLSGGEASAVHGQSLAGGEDLRIVRHSGGSDDLDRELLAFGSGSIRVRFKIQEGGGYGGGSDTYFLYVGAAAPSAAPADLHNVYLFFDDFESTTVGQRPNGWRFEGNAWSVANDGGNHVLDLPSGPSSRNLAEILGNTFEDVSVAASLRFDVDSDNNSGVFVRGSSIQDINSIYLWVAQLRAGENRANIVEYNGNYGPENPVTYPVTSGTWYRIEARVTGTSGTNMEMLVGGTSQVSAACGESGSGIGLFAYLADMAYDDVQVRRLTSPEPAVGLGAQQQPCQ